MARYTKAECRLCRREGIKLFLKGERCFSAKCPIEKKGAVPPGQHGTKSGHRLSEYGQRLREKQKAKRLYGVLEKQFRRYFSLAKKTKGVPGEALLRLLESRLDNVVYCLGLAPSRSVARQIVRHRHVLVDGKKVDIPSFRVKPGQVISLSGRAMKMDLVKKKLAEGKKDLPDWLKRKAAVGQMVRLPRREEIAADIDEQLIVEYYSR